MLTSTCKNCFKAKSPDDYGMPYCKECRELNDAANEALKKEHPDLTPDQLSYLSKQAMYANRGLPSMGMTRPDQFGRSAPQAEPRKEGE